MSKRYGFPPFVSISDGQILHLTTVNIDTSLTHVRMSVERKDRLLFERWRWIWQEGSAEGLLPIGDFVDRQEDRVDQILVCSDLEGNILFRKYFSFAPSMYLP